MAMNAIWGALQVQGDHGEECGDSGAGEGQQGPPGEPEQGSDGVQLRAAGRAGPGGTSLMGLA